MWGRREEARELGGFEIRSNKAQRGAGLSPKATQRVYLVPKLAGSL